MDVGAGRLGMDGRNNTAPLERTLPVWLRALRWTARTLCALACFIWLSSHRFPHGDFGLSAAGVGFMLFAGLLWCCVFWWSGAAWEPLSTGRQPGARRFLPLLIAPAMMLASIGLTALHIPFKLGWLVSKPSFQAAVEALAHDPSQTARYHRRLGAYSVVEAATNKDGDVFFVLDGGSFMYLAVIAYAPIDSPPPWSEYAPCVSFDGPWRTCALSVD